MAPAIFGSSVAQISILFDTLIASFLVTGSISWLYYSDRLMEFPLGVFGIALATVILPNLSRQHASASREQFAATLDWAIRFVILISAPASVGLVILAGPMLTTIFYGGEFTARMCTWPALSLMAYAAGLVGFTLVKVLAPGFFARQDTRTPVRIGLIALAATWSSTSWSSCPGRWSGCRRRTPGWRCPPRCRVSSMPGCCTAGCAATACWQPSPGWRRFLLRSWWPARVMAMLLLTFTPAAAALARGGSADALPVAGGDIAGAVRAYFASAVRRRPAARGPPDEIGEAARIIAVFDVRLR